MSSPAPKIVFSLPMPVRWRDMDAFGHVNNAAYLGFVEEARVAWFRSLSADWAGETSAPILAAVSMNYRKPAAWPEDVVVHLSADRLGTKSVTIGHRIVSAADPAVLYADGDAVLVWVDRSGATIALPDAVRAACTP
jgi:acyl-CoA thioester hydrolase